MDIRNINNTKKKNIYIDIDNTICYYEEETMDYNKAIPDFVKIEIVNKLFNMGHHIIMWSARGMKTGIDWNELTKKQLNEWNVKYHELKLNKPPFDILIDDKAINDLKQLNFN